MAGVSLKLLRIRLHLYKVTWHNTGYWSLPRKATQLFTRSLDSFWKSSSYVGFPTFSQCVFRKAIKWKHFKWCILLLFHIILLNFFFLLLLCLLCHKDCCVLMKHVITFVGWTFEATYLKRNIWVLFRFLVFLWFSHCVYK